MIRVTHPSDEYRRNTLSIESDPIDLDPIDLVRRAYGVLRVLRHSLEAAITNPMNIGGIRYPLSLTLLLALRRHVPLRADIQDPENRAENLADGDWLSAGPVGGNMLLR